MWYGAKAAIRAGYVDGTQWNNSNVGNYSVALGNNAFASGSSSVAIGLSTVASGASGIAIGPYCQATGGSSMSIGYFCQSTATTSFSYGSACVSSATKATAMGHKMTVSGASSFGININTDTAVTLSTANTFAVFGGNMGLGSQSFGTGSPTNVFAILTGTEPTSSIADQVALYSVDVSWEEGIDEKASLGLRTEREVYSGGTFTQTCVLMIEHNGTVYALPFGSYTPPN